MSRDSLLNYPVELNSSLLKRWRKGATLGKGDFQELVDLMARLRSPEGCAWDRAQDYDSLKGLVLEEAYEVVDAVNARDFDALEDELGDLLFQVIFYSRLAEEESRFSVGDVLRRAHEKLVRRHPHVFGGKSARTPEEALKSWLSVKEKERRAESKGEKPSQSLLDGIPAALPATLEAFELGVRASEVGFDWVKVEDLLGKLEEEIRELRGELAAHPGAKHARVEEEVGDLLFTSANLARRLRSDPESCLRQANRKFKRRFQALERDLAKRGKRVQDCSLAELDAVWETLKSEEGGREGSF